MNHFLTIRLSCSAVLAMLAFVPAAQATEDSFVIASAANSGRNFMPLKPVRDGVVRVDNGLSRAPMRSDRLALQNGFMRIDRASLAPIRNTRALVKDNPVVVLRGASPKPAETDRTVTDLFDSAAPESDFQSALQGTSGSVRHAWPVPTSVSQRLSSSYGMRTDPFHGRQAFHGGIDIAAASGSPVIASAEGRVSKVETGKGLGKYVAVTHRDGTESYYGHLSAQNVRVGQRVMQGQKVGELGSTGRSTGPHLDYRLKKNGKTVNPLTVMRQPTTRVAAR